MYRSAALVYGVLAYMIFLGTFLYMIGFVGNWVVPKSIDSGSAGPLGEALLINLALVGLFAVQHSVMARGGFKRHWIKLVPPPVERSTFVLITSLLLGLLFWQWRPMPGLVWEIEGLAGRLGLWVLCAGGWGLVLLATFMIDHFDLFGLRQVHLHAQGKAYLPPTFKVSMIYGRVRHPLLLGFIIAFWATPQMTVGHLTFALATTVYMLIAIQIEERDLIRFHGDSYRHYRGKVPMLLPSFRRTRA
jgi:protein-S-isoprenylcysteine O-methyltransferase Ste14